VSVLFCNDIDYVSKFTQDKTQAMFKILQNTKTSKAHKRKYINKIVADIFDYTLMSQIALGKYWRSISNDKRVKFISAFKSRLKNSYTDKLLLFDNQTLDVQKAKLVKKNRIENIVYLRGKQKTYEIKYKFYKTKDSLWKIYDVSISGISVIMSYKIQFGDFLRNKTIDELIATL